MASFFGQAFDPSQYGNLGGLSPEIIRMLQGLMPQGGAQFEPTNAPQIPPNAQPAGPQMPPVSGPQNPYGDMFSQTPERDFFKPGSGNIFPGSGPNTPQMPMGGPPVTGPSPMGQPPTQGPQVQGPPQQPGGGVLGTLGQQGGGLLNSILGGAGTMLGDAFKSPALRGGVIGNMFVGAEQRGNQQIIEQALIQRGMEPGLARVAAQNPQIMQQIIPSIFGAKDPPKTLEELKARLVWEAQQRQKAPGSPATPAGPGDLPTTLEGIMEWQRKEDAKKAASQAEATGIGTSNVEMLKQIQKDGLAAQGTLNTVQRLKQLNAGPDLPQGQLANYQQSLRSVMLSMGIINQDDLRKLKTGEEFEALSNKLVLAATGGSLGNQISNSDRDFIKAQYPLLTNSKQGRDQIIQNIEKLALRQQEVVKLADQYRASKGSMEGFQQFLSDWAEKNPIFKGPAITPGAANDPLGLR